MSLPWSKSVLLHLLPGCVSGTLEQGWLHRKVLASASHVTAETYPQRGAGPGPQASLSSDGLATSIDAVLFELAQTASLRGARLDAALADSLVHLDVVAGDFAGESDRQLDSIAVACVAELLGEAAPQHEIRWQLQPGEQHLLIGAIARDQILALSDAAARHALSLGSVQPDFCLQWNRHAGALKPGSGLFAVACGREAVIAHVSDGSIAAVSSGAWLDRHDAPGGAAARARHATYDHGLEASATAGALDSRADRLLASVGRDAAHPSAAYVLVAPPLREGAVSSRWTVLNREVHTS